MTFVIPDSSIVTPSMVLAPITVFLLWVMTMYWLTFANSRSALTKRVTFCSSSAASISSRRQKGDGFTMYVAKRSATAVIDFSPPERRLMFSSFFPGGCA